MLAFHTLPAFGILTSLSASIVLFTEYIPFGGCRVEPMEPICMAGSSGQSSLAGSCEHGSEPSVSIN